MCTDSTGEFIEAECDLVIPQVGKDFLADIILRNFFMSIIPLGNIEVMGNFSEVDIFVLSKFAPVWTSDFGLRSQKF